ncbi:MAG TPA: TatD family deoxyribonuclease [Candidatus Nealsonbacteria bacterium]|uniref:Hydrolase TatD n=1 Tax=marine sediment metagenome TaxID=412755 RepID=A0A0F9VB98_9ZZZZ|nr:TatD family deoxyribonuclease [Candidatus Nealsonbacteria bacterium]HEB46651.1 TatD family deoxyribonuclease [Candidatus Nealsonbacteria bacterium]
MLIDSHTHLNFNAFKDDVDEVIKRTLENNVWVINVGSQYSTSRRAVEIAKRYDNGVFAAIGLHPIHLEERKVDHSEVDSQTIFKTRIEEFDYEKYKNLALGKNLDFRSAQIKDLAQDEKSRLIGDPPRRRVVAIGEIGLDYYYKPKTKKKLEQFKEKQRSVLCQQLNLAKELNLPVIFHCRMAHDDLIQIIRQSNISAINGVVHCFTGDERQAQRYLEMGLYFGFNGLVFKKIEGAPDWQEIVKKLPLEKILIETDAPYLTPPPHEGQRNEPLYIKYVAQKIARIKNITFEEVTRITCQNTKKLFNI